MEHRPFPMSFVVLTSSDRDRGRFSCRTVDARLRRVWRRPTRDRDNAPWWHVTREAAQPRIHVYSLLEEDSDVVAGRHNEFHLRNVCEWDPPLDLMEWNPRSGLTSPANRRLPFACLTRRCRSLKRLFSVRVWTSCSWWARAITDPSSKDATNLSLRSSFSKRSCNFLEQIRRKVTRQKYMSYTGWSAIILRNRTSSCSRSIVTMDNSLEWSKWNRSNRFSYWADSPPMISFILMTKENEWWVFFESLYLKIVCKNSRQT